MMIDYIKRSSLMFYLHVSLKHFRLQLRLLGVLFLMKSSEPKPPVYRSNINLDSGYSTVHVFIDKRPSCSISSVS